MKPSAISSGTAVTGLSAPARASARPGSPLTQATLTSAKMPAARIAVACAAATPGRPSIPWLTSRRQPASVAGAFRAADLVADIVLAEGPPHRQPLDLLERPRVVDHECAVRGGH